MKKAKKYFLYARKSSESEDRQMASINDQITALKKFATDEGLEILDILSEARSAKAPGREVFNEMIIRIEKGEADGILCWKLNRLARNPIDGGKVSWHIQQSIISHISTPGRSYYPTDNVLMMAVELGMANQFIKELSEDVKRGLSQKAEKGWRPGHALPGYLSTPDKEKGFKIIEKDPIAFPIIQGYFRRLLDEEVTIAQLFKESQEKGVLINPKTRKPLSRSTLYKIFTLPFYAGKFEYPEGSGNWHIGKHEKMITWREYEKLQGIFSEKPPTSQVKVDNLPYKKLFACGECDMGITGHNKTKKQKNGNVHEYKFYVCTKKSKSYKCSQGSVHESDIEDKVEKMLGDIWIPPEFTQWAVERAKEKLEEKGDLQESEKDAMRKQIIKIDNQISKLIDMRSDGELTKEAFSKKQSEMEIKKAKIEKSLTSLEQEPTTYIEELEEHLDFAEFAKKRFKDGDTPTKRSVIKDLGWNRYILDKKVVIEPKKQLYAIQQSCKVMDEHNVRLEPVFSLNKRTFDKIHAKNPMLLRE